MNHPRAHWPLSLLLSALDMALLSYYRAHGPLVALFLFLALANARDVVRGLGDLSTPSG